MTENTREGESRGERGEDQVIRIRWVRSMHGCDVDMEINAVDRSIHNTRKILRCMHDLYGIDRCTLKRQWMDYWIAETAK